MTFWESVQFWLAKTLADLLTGLGIWFLTLLGFILGFLLFCAYLKFKDRHSTR